MLNILEKWNTLRMGWGDVNILEKWNTLRMGWGDVNILEKWNTLRMGRGDVNILEKWNTLRTLTFLRSGTRYAVDSVWKLVKDAVPASLSTLTRKRPNKLLQVYVRQQASASQMCCKPLASVCIKTCLAEKKTEANHVKTTIKKTKNTQNVGFLRTAKKNCVEFLAATDLHFRWPL